MTLELVVKSMIVAAAAAYLLAFVVLLFVDRPAGMMLFGLGWAVNAGIVVLNWVVAGEPPFGNMYHVLVFLGLCFLPLYLLLRYRHRLGWLHGYFALAAGVPLIGALIMGHQLLWRRMPALQSPWFMPHVVSYMISYALATVAFVLTVVGLAKRKRAEPPAEAPPGEERKGHGPSDYARASYETLRLGFPLMTFGLLSGALWAEEAWGRYWSWDPKETWSLITWTLYLVYFHCRADGRLRKWTQPAQIAAFVALVTTFIAVNLLPKLSSVLHSYT